MRYSPQIVLPIVCCVMAASEVQGAIAAFWQPITITPEAIADDPQLATMQCWDLIVTTDGDWAMAGMRAVLPAGAFFYKHPLGANFRPAPIPGIPALAFTTYLAFPLGHAGPLDPPPPGGFPEGQPASLGDPTATIPGTLSMTWGDLVFDPPGTYQIARLTFPQSEFPNVINIADVGPQGEFSRTSQVDPASTTEIPDIPEPSALGVVTVTCLTLTTRRRVAHRR